MFSRLKLLLLSLLVGSSAFAQDADIKILAINDIHSHVEKFARLGFIIDSIRAQRPDALLFSAGDNRTGNPVSDACSVPNMPTVEMMNMMGVNLSTMGNHECDAGQEWFAHTINNSNFPYIVANMHPHDTLRIHTQPFKLFRHKGVDIAVIGLIQIGSNGLPAALPKNMEGITYTGYEEEMARYADFLRKKSNVFIALTHLGYATDTVLARQHPELDLIIGGHSHSYVNGEKWHGVTVTQAGHYADYLSEIDIRVRGGKVEDVRCNNISVKAATGERADLRESYLKYRSNPALSLVVGRSAEPFSNKEELGMMVASALRHVSGADIAAQNQGGVRKGSLPAGDITNLQVLELDPFSNLVYSFKLTGQEIADFLADFPLRDDVPPFVVGIKYTATRDAKGKISVEIRNEDGSKFDLKKTYKFAVSQFVASISPKLGLDRGTNEGIITSDAIKAYLKDQKEVNFKGRKALTVIDKYKTK